MAIWNSRWAVVRGVDIAEKDPLRIGFREGEILDVRSVKETREAIQFEAEARGGVCYMDFDFLDRHDGVVLDLLHTGSDTDKPSIQGTVKGLPAGVSYYGDLTKPSQTAKKEEAGVDKTTPGQLAFLLLVAAAILIAVAVNKTHSHAPNTLWWLYLAAGLCIAAALMFLKIRWSRRLPRALAQGRSGRGDTR
jgi:hypothetical protein